MDSLSLPQGTFPIQGSNPGLPHCRKILYQLSHKGSPRILEQVAYPISSRSSQPRNQTRVYPIADRFFTNWSIREAHRVEALIFLVVTCWCERSRSECWRINVFELWCWRRLESHLDSKEIKPVNPKGNQSWIFIGRTNTEAEIPILWPPDVKSQLIGKDPDAGKDWRQEEKGVAEDKMVR